MCHAQAASTCLAVRCGGFYIDSAMQLDIHLLAKERKQKPDDTRVAFYYAQVRLYSACLPLP